MPTPIPIPPCPYPYHTAGSPPAARYNHGAALLGTCDVAIFGGSGGDDGRQLLSDVALLDVAAMTWTVTNNCTDNCMRTT